MLGKYLVILSGVGLSRSENPAKSKDPYKLSNLSTAARRSHDEQIYTPTGCFAPTGTGVNQSYRSAFSPRTIP
jgi:hypothetical protein